MVELDMRSRQPIYEQLVDKLKELIISEVLKPDEQLPSVRTLAGQLTINPNTIQKAYRELETQGYIYSLKGKGSFVNPISLVENSDKLVNIIKELKKLLSEAMYLGLKSEELIELVYDLESYKEDVKNDD
ncbi:GntR family transcriptional regulator [Peribacillus loiseleuriae]|uniref:GntR family transcriptional regulator n=1 Tax=Peribacillus loiseleuriae TaxID=1679170 RepID=UPI003D0125C8